MNIVTKLAIVLALAVRLLFAAENLNRHHLPETPDTFVNETSMRGGETIYLGYKLIDSDCSDPDEFFEPQKSSSFYEFEPDYPLLNSDKTRLLIDLVVKTPNSGKTEDGAVKMLTLLEEVAAEIENIPEALACDVSLANIIKREVEIIRHKEEPDIRKAMNFVWQYADRVIRYLGEAEYIVLG